MSVFALMMLVQSAPPTTPGRVIAQIDFRTGERSTAPVKAKPVGHLPGNMGARGGAAIALPTSPPSPAVRGSGFSALHRARDHFDIAAYPARAVAKLFRLNADGKRAAQACTAQFVGPKHLVTASHCLADWAKSSFYPGFELGVGFDKNAGRTVKVSRAWAEAAQLQQPKPEDSIVRADNCSDLAVIEIAEPVGAETGWLGMRDLAPTDAMKGAQLHRFSYPHQSAGDIMAKMAVDPKLPENIRAEFAEQAAASRQSEADFTPGNLYYEFGRADEAEGRYIAERNGYVLPGRSGSALIDASSAVVALLSRTIEGTSYNCRLTADDIGMVAAIMAQPDKR